MKKLTSSLTCKEIANFLFWESRHILERQGMRAVSKKEHILVNLEQFEDEPPLGSMQIWRLWGIKIPNKIQTACEYRKQ